VENRQGKSLVELQQQIKDQKIKKPSNISSGKNEFVRSTIKPNSQAQQAIEPSVRKDSSPVKVGLPMTSLFAIERSFQQPLSDILNLDRIFEKPHTADQISSLWTAYHASRSRGTGRGFICATIPMDIYDKMYCCGAKYPTFVVPLTRTVEQGKSTEANKTHEFHFLQWGFHNTPPIPTMTPFSSPVSFPTARPNPPISTILITPLQEYKLRSAFATPYLVLTNYTDLVSTHGIVLLRGEITPSASANEQNSSNGGFLLSQHDAQLLAMQLQQFYLWNGGDVQDNGRSKEKEQLLKLFHEKPEEFKWEDLLKHSLAGSI
jgi:ATP synthase mitochondrial F1 complex assembly factor 1